MLALRYALAGLLLMGLVVPNDNGQEPIRLTRLTQLGRLPDDAPTVTVRFDGTVKRPVADPLAPRTGTNPILQVDRRAEVGVVIKLLRELQTERIERVHFVAALPDGTRGCLTLALPGDTDSPTTMLLRMHSERTGVPPTSVVPVLRRMLEGLERERFVLGIEAPSDAPFEQLLKTVAATAMGGVRMVVLDTGKPVGISDPRGAALAVDLGPIPIRPVAVPQPSPTIRQEPVGCLERATSSALTFKVRRGLGAVYGGRRKNGSAVDSNAARIAASMDWLRRQQNREGSFADDAGSTNLETTAIALLTFLARGRNSDNETAVAKAIGWILSRQREDGSYADPGPGSTRRHGLATFALAEAYGLSLHGPMLRGSLEDALQYLVSRAHADGGFSDGIDEGQPDCLSTFFGLAALASAKFHRIESGMDPTDAVGWFNLVVRDNGLHLRQRDSEPDAPENIVATAAALLGRHFAGGSPKSTPVMIEAANLLLDKADAGDPWVGYWTTYSLYLTGGRFWAEWKTKIEPVIAQQVTTGEEAGSWAPTSGLSRTTTTALRLLTLTTYDRLLRLVR